MVARAWRGEKRGEWGYKKAIQEAYDDGTVLYLDHIKEAGLKSILCDYLHEILEK